MSSKEWADPGLVNDNTSLSVQLRSSSWIRLYNSSSTVGRLMGEWVGVPTGQYRAINSGVSWTTYAGQAHQSLPFKTPRITIISPGVQRIMLSVTWFNMDQALFIGRLVPQYGQLADCGPVHFTSCPRMGPLQLGQAWGKSSRRCS